VSAVALQRVAVRMLFDAAFADAVYRDADAALAGLSLTADERAWLRRPDRRAWGVDPMRRWRALTGLLEEYPVTGALARRFHGDFAGLDAFFSAPPFHACIQERRAVALAFGDFCASHRDPRVAAAARIELAIARVRRPRAAAGELVAMAEGVTVPSGALPMYQALAARLGGRVDAVADPRSLPAALPAIGPGVEHLVAERTADGGVGLGEASEPLVALLEAARDGAARADLLALARRYGCSEGEDAEVVDGLVAEGLLRRP
jgi:hypothetical protein